MAIEVAAVPRVLHVTPCLSRHGGGVSQAIWDIARASGECGIRHTAVAVADAATTEDVTRAPPGCEVHTFPLVGPRSIFFSPQLERFLRASVSEFDLVHVHGLRHWPGLAARRAAEAIGRPLIISPHGALYAEHLQVHRSRKWLLHALFERRTLQSAACLHATSAAERDSMRRFGCRNPIATVPLGIWLSPPSAAVPAVGSNPSPRRLLYLGMLRPKKGLLRLLSAWAALQGHHVDWELQIAGPSVDGYGEVLRREATRLGLVDRVRFLGPVYGDHKAALLSGAELLVLPSDWENFGIVVGEALATAVPVIVSRTAPWQSVQQHDCGWWIEPTQPALQAALGEALANTPADLRQRGERGRRLAQREFSWHVSGQKFAALYAWLAGRTHPPASVRWPDASEHDPERA